MNFWITSVLLLAVNVALISGQSSCSIFPGQLLNGKTLCYFGKFCSFHCKEGYELIGSHYTKCYHGKWTHPHPKCIEKKQLACEDPLPEIHADKFCSNGNLLGSVCEYECEIGFNLEGQPDATVCIQTNYGPRWSNPPPICRPDPEPQELICEETLDELSNADVFCSEGNSLGSVCVFECFHGFTRVGSALSTCIETKEGVQWSNPAPTCKPEQQTTCDDLPHPTFADLSCSNGNALGSVCEYECFLGFTLQGSSATTCMKTAQGLHWSSPPPLCRPEPEEVICESSLDEPSNADTTCSSGNTLGSVCEFECFHGFTRVGTATSTCVQTEQGTHWSHPAPICRPEQEQVDCEEFLEASLHADVFCPNGKSLGSVCEFECNIGFTRIGAATSTCVQTENGLKWSNPAPICRPGKTGYRPRS